MSTRHTLSILVKNKPGAFTRVTALFTRRAFNIHSFAIGETEGPRISRMTVMVGAAGLPIGQMTKQLNKLVNVLKTVEPDPAAAVERQLLPVEVSADGPLQANVLQIVDLFRAHVIDAVPDAVTVETTGSDAKVEALLAALEPYGVREIVQSGTMAITRGVRSLSERVAAELD